MPVWIVGFELLIPALLLFWLWRIWPRATRQAEGKKTTPETTRPAPSSVLRDNKDLP